MKRSERLAKVEFHEWAMATLWLLAGVTAAIWARAAWQYDMSWWAWLLVVVAFVMGALAVVHLLEVRRLRRLRLIERRWEYVSAIRPRL